MKKLLIAALFSIPLIAQTRVNPIQFKAVATVGSTAPVATCPSAVNTGTTATLGSFYLNTSTVTVSVCGSGGWTAIAGSGSGTVGSGSQYALTYYNATGTAVMGATPFTGLGYFSTTGAPAAATGSQIASALGSSPIAAPTTSTAAGLSIASTLPTNTTAATGTAGAGGTNVASQAYADASSAAAAASAEALSVPLAGGTMTGPLGTTGVTVTDTVDNSYIANWQAGSAGDPSASICSSTVDQLYYITAQGGLSECNATFNGWGKIIDSSRLASGAYPVAGASGSVLQGDTSTLPSLFSQFTSTNSGASTGIPSGYSCNATLTYVSGTGTAALYNGQANCPDNISVGSGGGGYSIYATRSTTLATGAWGLKEACNYAGVCAFQNKISSSLGISATTFQANTLTGTYSATLTIPITNGTYHLILTGNVTSSTIATGNDGERQCMFIEEDSTGGRSFVYPTSNVRGATNLTTSAVASKIYSQCFDYVAADSAWLAENAAAQ